MMPNFRSWGGLPSERSGGGRLHAVLGGLMLNVFVRSSHFLSRLPYSLH